MKPPLALSNRSLRSVARLGWAFVVMILTLPAASVLAENPAPEKTLLILGDSITAGYNVERSQSYPSVLERLAESEGKRVRVINGGLSGDTSAGGVRRLDWFLKERVDVFVLALGANDGLRGLSAAELKKNLLTIFTRVKAKNPHAKLVLAGMLLPPTMGEVYANQFRAVYPEVANEAGATLIPFLLEGVAAVPALNQPDRIHPTAEGHTVIANKVWPTLRAVLGE